MVDKYNIQYQVGEKNFANVVVNTVIKPKTGINMGMKVFASRLGMKASSAKTVRRVSDVEELDRPRGEIRLGERINKYVGEALRKSLYEKVKYEINVVLLEQKLGR